MLPKIVKPDANEKWLLDNKHALRQVSQGLKDAAADRVSEKGSFAKFVGDEKFVFGVH